MVAAQVAAGSFCSVPHGLTWTGSSEIAHLINGYELAPQTGRGDLQAFANRHLEDVEQGGSWPGHILDLWLCLFAEHRRERHAGGYTIEGERLRILDDLCAAFARACSQHRPDR
jgi:hypothetical protein